MVQRTRYGQSFRFAVVGFLVVLIYTEAVFARAGAPRANLAAGSFGQACFASVSARLVSQRRVGGTGVLATGEFESPTGFAHFQRELESKLRREARPGHLMSSTSGVWTILSFWRRDAMCMVQFRPAGRHVRGLVSVSQGGGGEPQTSGSGHRQPALPAWWPKFREQRLFNWLDGGAGAMSIVAMSRARPGRVSRQITDRASKMGLRISARSQQAQGAAKPGGMQAGSSILFIEGDTQRASVTIFPAPQGSGLVAHIQQRPSR